MKSILNFLLVTPLLILAKISNAQADNTKLPLPVQQILRWEGRWKGPATLQLDGKTYKSTYFADFKKTADGNGLYMNESCDVPGIGKMNGANLVGFDPNDGKIHWYSVDNMGTTHEHVGQFTNDNDFYMEHKSHQKGKQYVEKIQVNFKDKNTLLLTVIGTLDGNVQETIEATFTREMKN